MVSDDQPKTLQLWPLKSEHVTCSGLRASRVGIVHRQAWRWRVYCPQHGCNRWRVERVRIRTVDDKRDDGEPVEVALRVSRREAYDAIDEDARVLDAIGPLEKPTRHFGATGGAE